MSNVYVHTVICNNKKYVGQTDDEPEKRWGKNGSGYKGQLFYAVIEKYGWDNILHEVVCKDVSPEEADEKEKYYTYIYKTNVRRWGKEAMGYNLTNGGKDAIIRGCPVICIETNERWASVKECSIELKVNPSSLQESLYHGYRCCGKHYRFEDDNEYVIYDKTRYTDGVLCIETNEIYDSQKECCEKIGCNSSSLRLSINKGYACKGKHYRKLDDDNYHPVDSEAKKVLCTSTNTLFDDAKSCADFYGVQRSTVVRWINGTRKNKDGLEFEYCIV